METALWAALFIVSGYLLGSVNYAIIVTRLVNGEDIRELGNGNPGTSNVMRSVGKPAGILVGFLDAIKGIVPALVGRLTVFGGDEPIAFFVLYLVGIAAVVGHARPLFYGFRGGGGIGTMQGVSLFFVPVEYLFSMLLGGTIVLVATKKTMRYRLSRWTPIAFTILTPFVTLATALVFDVPIFAHISIGGQDWGTVAGAFAMSLTILALNIGVLRESSDDVREARD